MSLLRNYNEKTNLARSHYFSNVTASLLVGNRQNLNHKLSPVPQTLVFADIEGVYGEIQIRQGFQVCYLLPIPSCLLYKVVF